MTKLVLKRTNRNKIIRNKKKLINNLRKHTIVKKKN